MATLGFNRADFQVFEVEGFNERMAQLYATVRPKLLRLGDDLAPQLARKLHLEFFPHVAKHARRTVNPPPETWCAFGPSSRMYCFTCNSRSRAIIHGPKTIARVNDVSVASAVRTVM